MITIKINDAATTFTEHDMPDNWVIAAVLRDIAERIDQGDDWTGEVVYPGTLETVATYAWDDVAKSLTVCDN